MAKVQLNFEFDIHEEQEEFQIQAKAQEMHTMLTDLDVSLRQEYEDNEVIDSLLKNLIGKWLKMIAEVGVL